jgi:hypothetical protein
VGDRVEVDLVGVVGETTGVGVGSGDGDKTESGNVRTAPLTSFETSSQKYDLRLEFKDSTPCQMDFLMVRYNMAHTKSEWRLFPVARARDVPVIAFTSTRWNTLTQTHPAWQDLPPTVAQCMDFCASHPGTCWGLSKSGGTPWRPDYALSVSSGQVTKGTNPHSPTDLFLLRSKSRARSGELADNRGAAYDLGGCAVRDAKKRHAPHRNRKVEQVRRPRVRRGRRV